MIQAHKYREVAGLFKNTFGLNLNDFCDYLTTTSKEFGFDFNKFVDVISERHPQVVYDNVSISDVIETFYGTQGVKLIDYLI